MAKIRIHRSEMGPICATGMIAGIGIAVFGLFQLSGNGLLSSDEAFMAIVGGLILFVLALISRIANAPYINAKKQMLRQSKVAYQGSTASVHTRVNPQVSAPAAKPLPPEEQKLRYVLSQLPPAQDFGGYLDGLKARGLTEEDLKKPEIAVREFQQQPSKSFLYYLQLNAPESYQKVLSLYIH